MQGMTHASIWSTRGVAFDFSTTAKSVRGPSETKPAAAISMEKFAGVCSAAARMCPAASVTDQPTHQEAAAHWPAVYLADRDGRGSFVWRQCDGQTPLGEVAARLQASSSGERGEAGTRVMAFLRQLARYDSVTFLAPDHSVRDASS